MPADNSFSGTTAALRALAPSDTPLCPTRAPGFDPPRDIDSSRGRRPPPLSYTPRPPGPDHVATVGLRCGKAGAGTSFALYLAFPHMNGGRSGLFPVAEDPASLVTPPTSSGVGTRQKTPSASTQVPPTRDPFLKSSGVSAASPSPAPSPVPPLNPHRWAQRKPFLAVFRLRAITPHCH